MNSVRTLVLLLLGHRTQEDKSEHWTIFTIMVLDKLK